MTDAQELMAKYKASNDAYNELRHLANDCRIAGRCMVGFASKRHQRPCVR